MKFRRGPKRAAVLGCGPAGLFATHALIERGWKVQVFSKKRPSELFGAQYLHAPIPGLTETDPITVHYKLVGSAEEYRQKVYGPNQVTTSVEHLDREHPGWDIREAYRNAWDRYSPLVMGLEMTPVMTASIVGSHDFDRVISTIPMPSLCLQPDVHQFHAANVWAIGDAPERGQSVPYRSEPNTVECNGSRDTGWYRASNVFGYGTVEWPGRRKPPLPGVAEVRKPLYTDCTCHRNGGTFVPLGRYGQWTKGVLSHHAYTQAGQL